MKGDSCFMSNTACFGNGLYNAGFVICPHDRCKSGVVIYRLAKRIDVESSAWFYSYFFEVHVLGRAEVLTVT